MTLKKMIFLPALLGFAAVLMTSARPAAPRTALGRPDLDSIRAAVTDENSKWYYPRLLKEFMGNDTTMTDVDFQYFYYGALFQEDYDPYRGAHDSTALRMLAPIYAKSHRSRYERKMMLDYADEAIADNPLDLRQLTNRIFVYEKNGKYDLAKIWQYKLNHLLLVIASSGSGIDAENAWVVVYPQHEYDFLNLSGITATAQRFVPPGYDYIMVKPKSDGDREGYYFDIAEMLRQYFAKHPSELEGEDYPEITDPDEPALEPALEPADE